MKKNIAILHFASLPNIGGVEILIDEHAKLLVNLGHQVTVIAGDGASTSPDYNMKVIPQLQSIINTNVELQNNIFEGKFDQSYVDCVKVMLEILQKDLKEFDTLIIHNMLSVSRNLAFTEAFHEYAKNSSQKIIVYIHDHMYVKLDHLNLDAIRSEKEKKLLTTVIPNATYVTISHTIQKQLAKVLPLSESDIHVVYNGINIPEFMQISPRIWELFRSKDILTHFPIIFSPVNIIRRKNILYSLELVSELKKTYPDLRYIISGDTSTHFDSQDYLKQINDYISTNQLQENIIFLKDEMDQYLKPQDVRQLYALSDCVFYFSASENFGLPLLEASLSKTLLFTSDLEVFKEIGNNYIKHFDTNLPAAKVAPLIEKILSEDEHQLFYKMRSQFNLEDIVRNELAPLL
ncbi:MAG: glycosyltransferase family 4 protein [Weeksellaceae bacterium]